MLLPVALFYSFFMAEWYYLVFLFLCHILFMHPAVEGHLGCFCALAVVKSTAVNRGVRVSFSVTVLCGVCPVMGLLDHVVVLFLVFKGPSVQFPIAVAPLHIPSSGGRGFSFLHTVSSTY